MDKNFIKTLFLRKDGTPNPSTLSGKKGNDEVKRGLKFLRDLYGEDVPYPEAFYLFMNDLERPLCRICKVNHATFYSYKKGHNDICNDKDCIVTKRRQTNKEIYGVENAAQADSVREKISKNPRKVRFAPVDQVYDIKDCLSVTGDMVRGFPTMEKYADMRAKLKYRHGDKTDSFSEMLYFELTGNGIEYCAGGCGSRKEFLGINKGYSQRLCMSCAAKECEGRRVDTMKERYGPNFKQVHYERCKQTNLRRYGKENVFQVEEFKLKSRQTMKKKYDVEYTSQSQELRTKAEDTIMSKHGVRHYTQSAEYKSRLKSIQYKTIETNRSRYGVDWFHVSRLPDEIIVEEYLVGNSAMGISKRLKCSVHSIYPVLRRNNVFRRHRTTFIEEKIENILVTHGINLIKNDKKIFSGKMELDFYLPDHQIAIETNGLYWHSIIGGKKEKRYHQEKYLACREKEIKLFQLWEPDIEDRIDIIESMILNATNKIDKRVYARKCEVMIPSFHEFMEFFDANHIQGKCPPNTKAFGLYLNGEMVSCIGYVVQKDMTIMTRYCSKLRTSVPGGFSKLLKRVPGDVIRTYSSNDISWGGVYEKNGFKLIRYNTPDLWFTDYRQMFNRQAFTKKAMKRRFGDIDVTKTEWQIAFENGYDRIYKSGTVTWELKR